MLNYIIRRLIYVVPLLIGVAIVNFILFNAVGGDPVLQYLGPHATKDQILEYRHEMGLDRAWPLQILHDLKGYCTFDFGRSWETRERVSAMILRGIWPSFSLAAPAFFIVAVLAICIAMFAAFYHNTWVDRTLVVLSVLGMNIPILALIIAGQYYLAYKMRVFPVSGYEFGIGSLAYVALPALIWIGVAVGGDVRFYRTVMLNETRQDYVTTAFAKGLGKGAVMFKHVLKNAMIPILTRLVVAIPFLFTGSLLLENFFGIPGLGNMGINAINAGDRPVLKAIVFIGALLFIVANLISDLTYAMVDPRVQLGEKD